MNSESASLGSAATPAYRAPLLQLNGSLVLLLILALSTLLDLYFFTGYFASDDRSYFMVARNYLESGKFEDGSLGATRLMLVGWVMLVIRCFGPNLQLVAASFIVFHQVLNALTYLMVREQADRRAALLAAYLAATFPLLVVYASMILPDVEQACAGAAAVLCYAIWRKRRESRPVAAWLAFFASGLCVGLAYACKESALVLLPFFFVAWLTTFKRSRPLFSLVQGAAFALGFFVVFAGEYVLLSQLAGESVFRLSWTTEDLAQNVQTAVDRYGTHPGERLDWVNRRLEPDVWPTHMKILCGAALLLLPLLKSRLWTLSLLPLWMFAFQVWGTMNLRRYAPPTIQARYFAVILPFVLAALAIVAVRLYDRVGRLPLGPRAKRCWRTIATGAAVIVPLLGLTGPDRQAGKAYKADIVANATQALRWTQSFDPTSGVLLCSMLAHHLEPFQNPSRPEKIFAAGKDLTEEEFENLLRGGNFYYIALHPDRLWGERKWLRSSPIDELLRSTAYPTTNPLRTRQTDKLIAYRSASGSGIAQIPIAAGLYEIATRRINSFTQTAGRTAGYLVAVGAFLPLAPASLSPASRTVEVYHVEARPVEIQRSSPGKQDTTQETATPLLVHDLLPDLQDARSGEDQQILRKWALSQRAANHRFELDSTGWKLHTNLGKSEYAMLSPRSKEIARAPYELLPRKRYQIHLDVELEKPLQVEFLTAVSDRTAKAQQTAIARTWLNNGMNVLGLCTEEREVYFQPSFKLIGPGSLRITRFAIYQMD